MTAEATGYDLWDLESGNMVAHAGHREELLARVRQIIADDGEDCASMLGLSSAEYEDFPIAGRDLIELALQSVRR